MSSKSRSITFVLLCYNQRTNVRLLAECIQPLMHCCDHLLVIDDCSNEPILGRDLAHIPRARVVNSNVNLGPGARRNYAISAVTTDLIIFIDGDDQFCTYSSSIAAIELIRTSSELYNIVVLNNSSSLLNSYCSRLHPLIVSFFSCFQLLNNVTFANKAYEAAWLRNNSVYYSRRRLFEDVEFHFRCLLALPRVFFDSGSFYYVVKYPSSRSRSFMPIHARIHSLLNIGSDLFRIAVGSPFGGLFLPVYLLRLILSLAFTMARDFRAQLLEAS
jgi:glycosyltransferase involved in cell wall biosynthesis